jgi:beta-N-acetylhexosaminidase
VARVGDLRTWLAGFEQPPSGVVGSSEHAELADELARRSITRIRDRDDRLPLRPREGDRILVVEPRPRDLTPADTTSWLPAGGLAAALRERWPALDGIVVDVPIAEAEIGAIATRAGDVDLVVLGTVDALGEPGQADLARALVARGVRVVAVALRAPWDADAYPEVGTVVATYGIQPPTLRALAAALAGEVAISGRLPVRLTTD